MTDYWSRDICDRLIERAVVADGEGTATGKSDATHFRQAADEITVLRERLQAIIDWCDIAMKNADEFDSHGVRNLDGPIFDEARNVLSKSYHKPNQ